MQKTLQTLLASLEQFGQENDQRHTARPQRMLNITRDTGEFLSVLVTATQAKSILEIGTSNGYSTLWLAEAAKRHSGKVVTVELSAYKNQMAAQNFAEAGLTSVITQHQEDAGAVLKHTELESVDLLFLDSERSAYLKWWADIRRVLKPGGILVVDNAVSHAEEMAAFMDQVTNDEDFQCSLVPVGNGEFLAVKHRLL